MQKMLYKDLYEVFYSEIFDNLQKYIVWHFCKKYYVKIIWVIFYFFNEYISITPAL